MRNIHLTRLFREKRQLARRAQEGEVFLIYRRKQPFAYMVSSAVEGAVDGVQLKGRLWDQDGEAIYLLAYPLGWSGVPEAADSDALLQVPPVVLRVMQAQGLQLPAAAEYEVLGAGEVELRFVGLSSRAA